MNFQWTLKEITESIYNGIAKYDFEGAAEMISEKNASGFLKEMFKEILKKKSTKKIVN